jgi:hypothetical protein
MASREHSGVRASLPPVDGGEARAGGDERLVASGGFTRRTVLGVSVAVPVPGAASSSRGAELSLPGAFAKGGDPGWIASPGLPPGSQ